MGEIKLELHNFLIVFVTKEIRPMRKSVFQSVKARISFSRWRERNLSESSFGLYSLFQERRDSVETSKLEGGTRKGVSIEPLKSYSKNTKQVKQESRAFVI